MTDMTRWYVLDVNPEPWAIGPVGYARRNGKMAAYVGRNAQLDTYKQTVKEAILALEPPPDMLTGKLSVTFWFWRNRAEYQTPQARTHRKHEADVTNLQKATEDALQDILYKNDKDNSHVESILVAQGPDVIGKIIIRISKVEVFDPAQIPIDAWKEIEKIDHPDVYDKRSRTLYGDERDIF